MAPLLSDSPLVRRFREDLAALAGPAPEPVGIALSGGPDSAALLLLAAAAFPGGVAAATVDHRLRPESAAEAGLAARLCAGLGVPHRILPVSVPEGASVQAQARAARYAALAAWADTERLAVLLTAHHADDQAETLLMRLNRGSGVGGLGGVRASAPLGAATLLCRPLLGWRRRELAAIVGEAGIETADDPSNRDQAYDRVRVRRALAEAGWIDVAALARSAAALAEADSALERAADGLAGERIGADRGAVLLRPDGIPAELLRRLLLRCLRSVCPAAAPRGEQVGALIGALGRGETRTLAGVRCRGGPVWRFDPAPPRR